MFGRIFGFGKVYSAEYSDSAKITIRHTPTENRIFFQKNSEAWILIKFQWVIYLWILLNELYKLMNFFFFKLNINFQNFCRIFGRKPKNIQKNSEAWILIKLQRVICQWFWLDKLYELVGRFLQISESFFEFTIFWNKWRWVYASELREAYVLISTRSSSMWTDRQFSISIYPLHEENVC